MKIRSGLAGALIIAWLLQLINLWPLPSEVAGKLLASATSEDAAAISSYEKTLWLGWAIRAVLIPLGIVSGVWMFQNRLKWPDTLFVVSAAALILFRVWQWWEPIYAPLFGAFGLDRAAWLVKQPLLLFNTLIFPIGLVVCVVYGIVHLTRSRHAI